ICSDYNEFVFHEGFYLIFPRYIPENWISPTSEQIQLQLIRLIDAGFELNKCIMMNLFQRFEHSILDIRGEILWVAFTKIRKANTERKKYKSTNRTRPALYKIMDEIFVNAADNKVRDQEINVFKVDIDKEGGQFSVFNNGKGIYDENVYIPFRNFFIFTFNDDLKKVSG
ncbi:9061_t:CDS:2, partial [Funneliformis geosporum]